MQVQFAVGGIAARGFRDIRDMPEIVAVGALRAAEAEMRADAPIDGLHPLGVVFVDRKAAHDHEARPALDPLQQVGEIARRAPGARNARAGSRGTSGRRLSIRAISSSIAARCAGVKSQYSASRSRSRPSQPWRWRVRVRVIPSGIGVSPAEGCLPAGRPERNVARIAARQGCDFFRHPRCWPRGFALSCRRFRAGGSGGVGPDGGGGSASGRRRAAPRSGADGGADGDLHAGRRKLDRSDRAADDHRPSRRVSPVQLGIRGAVPDDGGDDPALRAARRHIRAAPGVLYRHRDLPDRHDAVRVRPVDGAADRSFARSRASAPARSSRSR